MTFPTILSVIDTGAEGTTVNAAMPASGINSGDLLILIAHNDGSEGGDFIDLPSGDWQTNYLEHQNFSSFGLTVSWIIADGTENGTIVQCDINGVTTETIGVLIVHIQNNDSASAPEFLLDTTNRATDTWESIGPLTPSWDSSSIDTMWLASAGKNAASTTWDDFPPNMIDNNVNYTDPGSQNTPLATNASRAANFTSAEQTSAHSDPCIHRNFLMAIRGTAGGISIEVPTGPVW